LLSANPKAEFHTFATSRHEPARFTDEFLEKQWVVQAPILDFTEKKWLGKPSVVELEGKIDSRCPLPFLKMKDLVNISATVVNKIDLHPAHLQGFPVSTTLIHAINYTDFRKAAKNKTPLTVAVKHFKRIDDFNKERINLEKTGRLNNPNLIHHLAMYQRENFFCIMFPWADGGDLRKFWKERNSTQRTPELTLWSLRQMLGLSSALAVLHSGKINCRHGDLKPDNILHFSNDGEESLVIADFGISSFHANVTMMRAGITQSKATTPAYQAPEAGLVEKGARSRRYDIWSLGCIFLEFVIWLMYDVEAIHSFKYARKDAPYRGFYDLTEDGTSAIVHPIVSQTLNDLRLDDRCKDDSENGEGKENLSAIGALLDLIEKHLLLADVNQRDTAEQVHSKLKEIVQKAEKRSSFLFRVDSASESAPIFRQDVPADFEEEPTAYTSTG
jgi:serine/threonine protein kinase